ncbi:MAG TPA: UvrD-helicase domain-containing protein, partial [Candidatus Dependentiae bacterium]|nr:UvrD-helicase domain-containing protein [Candidatus Dependentiae bacterium]
MKNHKQEFAEFINTQLNPEQQQAVLIHSGPVLVVAGAGSGKTRVITARIANLILNENAIPTSIIALTFTNKAAQEMQHRITHFLGKLPEMPFIGTFHSYCLRFLKTHQEHLTIPFFSILDEDDQQKIISGIIKRNGLSKKVTAKQVSYQISLIKNQSINPEEMAEFRHDQFMYEIYQAYETEKRTSKCYDFDDLLLETVKLLRKNTLLQEQVHQSIEHVLVDEYQDTNLVQNELLKLLTRKDSQELAIKSICVVGDEDQSIYSWRGATVSNILNFKKEFKGTSIIKIEQNYRSVQPILEAANQVIIHNEQRNPKNLWSTREGSDRVLLLACNSEYQEADAVTSFLKTVTKHKVLETAAVLYRAHYQSRSIEEALIKRSIPYTIIGVLL